MASTTVETPSSDHLHAEALPLIDLRLLSQSELHALSLSSASSTVDLRRCDDVVIPTIDRSVFNESAGSRKQTYSRLRLAPRKPQFPSSSPSSAATANTIPRPIHPRSHPENGSDDIETDENRRIVGLLKELFAVDARNDGGDDDNDGLISVPVEYGDSVPKSSNVVFQTVPVDVAEDTTGLGTKRKRGRKPKKTDDKAVIMNDNDGYSISEDRDKEIVNKNGVVVDISALASMDDPFGPELRRKTEGMETEEGLLAFLSGLDGQWGSRRKKRKFVEASDFGDALPISWKLLLSIKKKDGRAWLICRRYISPSGREFISCKEISSYLLSFIGPQDASVLGNSDESNQLAYDMSCVNDVQQAASFTFKDNNKIDDITCTTPTAITSLSTDCEKPFTLLSNQNPGEVQVKGTLNCPKCSMNFDEKDDLLHHLLSSHKKSGKTRKLGTAVSDGVIIKDGIFECQFCHKTFLERHRYNGHVGIHVKKFVKNLEASSGVITMPKSIDPVSLGGGPPIVTEMQITISSCTDTIAKSYNARANDCPKSGSPLSELQVGSVVETCTKEYSHELHSLPQDRRDMKVNRKNKITDEKSCNTRGKKYKMANGKKRKVGESADIAAAQLNCSLGLETTLSKNENDILLEKFDEPNFLKNTANRVGDERSSDSCLLTFSSNKHTCFVEDNMHGVSTSVMEDPKQDFRSERDSFIPIVNERTSSAENIAVSLPFNTIEELKIDDPEQFGNNGLSIVLGSSCTGPDEHLASEVKQQGSSEGFSFDSSVTEPKGDVVNNMEGILTSRVAESNEESGSEIGLLTAPYDGQACGVNVNVNRACSSTLDEPNFEEVDNSGIKELNINFGTYDARPDEDAATSFEQEISSESCSPLISCNQQTSIVANNEIGVSAGRMEDSCMGKVGNIVSPSTAEELELAVVKNSGKSELIMSVGSNQSGLDVEVMTNFEQRKGSEDGSFVLPRNEQRFLVENNFIGVCNNSLEELNQGRASESCLLIPSCKEQNNEIGVRRDLVSMREKPKSDEVRNSWSSELIIGLGSSQAGLDVNRNFEGHSIVFSGNEHPFGVENNVTGIYGSVVQEPKQESGFRSSLFSNFGNDQFFGVENNSKQFYTGTGWEGQRLGTLENSRNNDLMIDFGNSLARPVEDVVADAMWRTDEENILQSRLPDASLPMAQSSSCFTAFDFISDKGENELFNDGEKFDSLSGFEGIRPGSMEHMEYNFFTPQTNTLAEDSKVLSYDVEMEQAFDSSLWLGKETLLPKTASRNQFTANAMCVWCGNEFQHDAFNSGTQTGSIGYICPTCKAKISGQLNVL